MTTINELMTKVAVARSSEQAMKEENAGLIKYIKKLEAGAVKETPAKCKQVELYEGLSIQKGSDGHCLSFSAEGRHATINIENTFSRPGITRSAILAWVNGVFSTLSI